MASSTLLNPQMQSLLAKHLGVVALCKFGMVEPRKKTHKDFYRNYDSMKDFEDGLGI